jgi:hypothetical protein
VRKFPFHFYIALGDDCAIEFPNNGAAVIAPNKVKDEEKRTFESIMKRVNTGGNASVEEEGVPLTQEK